MAKTSRPEAYSEIQAGVGERIRWVREKLIPNRSEAARVMGIDPSTLTKIEDGSRAPSIFNVIEIANRFRVSTDFLLRGLLVAKTDYELALVLAAEHPELAPQVRYMDENTGKAPGADKFPPPKIPPRPDA